MTTPEDILKEHRLWDIVKIYDAKTIMRVNVVSAMKRYAKIYHNEQHQASEIQPKPRANKKALRLFSVVLSFFSGGKKKPKFVQSCKNCGFDGEYCKAPSYYANKGMNVICFKGEIWKPKESDGKSVLR